MAHRKPDNATALSHGCLHPWDRIYEFLRLESDSDSRLNPNYSKLKPEITPISPEHISRVMISGFSGM